MFSLSGDLWTLQTWMSKFLPRFGKFLAIISLNRLPAPFPPSSPFRTPAIHKLVPLICTTFHESSLHSFSFFFFFQVSSDCIISKFLFNFTDSFFCLIKPTVLYRIFFFPFHSLSSSTPEFLFGSFSLFQSLWQIFYIVNVLFS